MKYILKDAENDYISKIKLWDKEFNKCHYTDTHLKKYADKFNLYTARLWFRSLMSNSNLARCRKPIKIISYEI